MRLRKKIILRQVALVLPAIFFALVIFFAFIPHTHAAWIEPIYQVLGNTSAGTTGGVVAQVWQGMMYLVNGLVLIALIYVAFMNILRIQMDSYAVKKFLPTFIMAVILANFSFLIARIVIDLGNIAISLFLFGSKENQISGAFDALIGEGPPAPAAGNYYWVITAYNLSQLGIIVGAILIFVLSFIFLIRNYLLYFLVAIAPIAFMAMALPITKKYFQQWWAQFTKWVFMPVIAVFWLWLANLFYAATQGSSMYLPLIFAGLCYYMAITSSLKADKLVGTWAGLGKKAWGATGGQATGYAKGRLKEEYGYQKLKAANWAASKKFVPTRRGMMSPRDVAAMKRQRLAAPTLVSAKKSEDANAAALKRYLDDHFSGRRKLPEDVVNRYNAELRKRNLEEIKTHENEGAYAAVGAIDQEATLDNGLLAMPTTKAGVARYKEEDNLKDTFGYIATLQKYLNQGFNSPNFQQALAALSERQADGNTKLGKWLGHRIKNVFDPNEAITPEDIKQWEKGLTTFKAIDKGPYANVAGGKAKHLLEEDGSQYRLKTIGEVTPEMARRVARIREIRRNPDAAGNLFDEESNDATSSGVPMGRQQTPDERTADLSRTEELLEQILEKTGRTEEIDKKAADAIKPTGLGVGAAIVPEIDVRIKGIDPAIAEQLRILQTRVAKANGAQALRLQQQQEATLQTVAQQLKSGQSPEEIEKLVAQGQSLLEGGDVEGARNIALQINPAAGPSLDLTQKGSTHE